jgi:hypothetical protein
MNDHRESEIFHIFGHVFSFLATKHGKKETKKKTEEEEEEMIHMAQQHRNGMLSELKSSVPPSTEGGVVLGAV